jgi:hypothetical protein
MAGRIRFVPLEFVVRDFNFRSDVDVRPAARFVGPIIGDYRVGFAVSDVDFIRPSRRRLRRNTTRSERPAASGSGTIAGLRDLLLPIVPDRGRPNLQSGNQKDKDKR